MDPEFPRKRRKAEEDLSPAYSRRLRQQELAANRENLRQEILLHERNIRGPIIDQIQVNNNNNNNDNINNNDSDDGDNEDNYREPVALNQAANNPLHEDIPYQEFPLNDAIDIESLGSDRGDELDELNNDLDEAVQNQVQDQPADFRARFAATCASASLTHTQVNMMLGVLREHHCFANLPKDARTLLGTPRARVQLYEVSGGEYLDLGLENALRSILERTPRHLIPQELIFDFSTDGAKLDNGNDANAWPIQVRVVNIPHSIPEFVAIWLSNGNYSKPRSFNEFFRRFVLEYQAILDRNGIIFENELKPIRIRAFIADAPARANVLCHKGHGGYSPCSRCTILGVPSPSGKVIYPDTVLTARTEEDYYNQLDHEHHNRGDRSILHELPGFHVVKDTVFDWMHTALLRMMPHFFSPLINGKYNQLLKLDELKIQQLNSRLRLIANNHCPCEFSRKPVDVTKYSKEKATEYRQQLLHTGFVFFRGILTPLIYYHFLKLACSLKLLVRPATDRENSIAESLLTLFVKNCRSIYGPDFYTYACHSLLHLAEDAKNFGPLDNVSAFPYENAMQYFNHTSRKPTQYLQQINNRRAEKVAAGVNAQNDRNPPDFVPGKKWMGDNLPAYIPANTLQYQLLRCPRFTVNLNGRDDTLILRDESICIVQNVIQVNNEFQFLVKRFVPPIEPLFEIGWPSTFFGILRCSALSNDTDIININEVRGKCFRMPYFNNDECKAVPNVWVISLMTSTFN